MKKIYSLLFCFFCLINSSKAQNFTFQIELNKELVTKNKLTFFQGDSITISNFKFYLSNFICIDQNGREIWNHKEPALIDVFGKNELVVPQGIIQQTQTVNFEIGVDTILTAMPPLDGDLSAKNGMFWTWKEGYMSVKLEGKHSLSTELKNQYTLHLSTDKEGVRPIAVVHTIGKRDFIIQLDDIFLEHSFSAFPNVMDIGESSTVLLQSIANSIRVL